MTREWGEELRAMDCKDISNAYDAGVKLSGQIHHITTAGQLEQRGLNWVAGNTRNCGARVRAVCAEAFRRGFAGETLAR